MTKVRLASMALILASFLGLVVGCAPQQVATPTAPPVSKEAPAAAAPTAAQAAAPAAAPTAAQAPAKPAAPAPATPPSVVKIGVPWSVTGSLAPNAEHAINAVKMAEQEIKDAGGFKVGDKTYIFQMIYKDDRSDTAQAGQVALQLVKDEGVKYMIGGYATPAVSMGEVAKANRVLFIFGSSAVQVHLGEPGYDLFFPRISDPETRMLGLTQATVQLMPNAKKFVWIMPEDTTAKEVVDQMKKAGNGLGLQVDSVLFPPATTDVTPFVTKVKQLSPDIAGIGMTAAIAGTLTRAIIEQNAAPAIAGYSINYDMAKAGVGKVLDRPYVQYQPGPSIGSPTTDSQRQVAAAYAKFLGKADASQLPNPGALDTFQYGYDFIFMLAKAMHMAGTTEDVEAVAKQYRAMTFEGKIATMKYEDKTNKLHLPVYGTLWQDGKSVKVVEAKP